MEAVVDKDLTSALLTRVLGIKDLRAIIAHLDSAGAALEGRSGTHAVRS